MAEHMNQRRPRAQFNPVPISESDPNPLPQIPSIIQSTRCKSTISSLLLSTFSNTTSNETLPTSINSKKKNNFPSATLRGLGCTASASQQVSVPAVIRSSADWEGGNKKSRKKKQNMKKKSKNKTHQGIFVEGSNFNNSNSGFNSVSCVNVDVQDVWCGPGIGFSASDAAVDSVDCVVARRNFSARGKIDGERISHRERSCLSRRTVNSDNLSLFDSDPLEVFGSRYHRHARHPSPDGFAELMLFHSNLLIGGRMDGQDLFREMRLDVDNMSYEQLLELGERIGYVNTGLKEDEISRSVRKTKSSTSKDLPSLSTRVDRKCSICQEEYEDDDEMGKLDCGHSFHLQCIKQWLYHKNACPVCKTAVSVRV